MYSFSSGCGSLSFKTFDEDGNDISNNFKMTTNGLKIKDTLTPGTYTIARIEATQHRWNTVKSSGSFKVIVECVKPVIKT